MNKVYVAGKFEDKENVRRVQQRLRDLGFEITHDWTPDDASDLQKSAVEDFEGVLQADFLVVLNHTLLYGAAVEIGIALGLGRPVYVIGPQVRDNVFWHLPQDYGLRTFLTEDEAFAAIEDDEFLDIDE